MAIEKKLEAALEYQNAGFSVIPVGINKKPIVSWANFQKEKADELQIVRWWNKYPDANIGIVTGKISNLTVVDTDSEVANQHFQELLNGNTPPTATTPRGGRHFYFSHNPDLHTCSNALPDTDIRSEGGFIIAPPSQNGKGVYAWQQGLSILNIKPMLLPLPIINVFTYEFNKRGFRGEREKMESGSVHTSPQMSTDVHNFLNKGNRDECLFSLAYHLVKSGMPIPTIENYLYFFAANCNPPFPANEVQVKINSALQRADKLERNLMQEVKDFVLSTNGYFASTDVHNSLQLSTRQEKKNISTYMTRLVDEGICERYGNKNGQYRRIESQCDDLDFQNATTETVDLWLPFGIDEKVYIMPGNIIVVAGEPNSGKTGILLNIIKNNMHRFDISYFSSEMGASELKKRLMSFDDMSMSDWNFKAKERSANFADVIRSGKGMLNVIDFLELHDNFYEVG